ncbi:MAG: phosphomethylpyrimidine synthase ThiC, partial [Selenomonadaceae bacterium]|nr:phosphomethylpyrimidine synthase ThiC [Selenomonadaceae bacterium]
MSTQMQAARAGRITDQMKQVAAEEKIPVETIRERVANGTIAICANINHR